MEKESVFFSCVCKECYKEFKIDNVDEVLALLKKEEFYLLKYSSAFSDEERSLSFEKLSIIQNIKRILENGACLDFNSAMFDQIEVNGLNNYVFNLLSMIKLRSSLSISDNKVSNYIVSLNRVGISNPDLKEEALTCIHLCDTGISNTEYMMNHNLVVMENEDSFSLEVKQVFVEEKEEVKEKIKIINYKKKIS